MPEHRWGDKDFDWNSLNNAMDEIIDHSLREMNLHVSLKEKYGTIRYEMLHTWKFTNEEPFFIGCSETTMANTQKFKDIVFETADKYPHIKEEILEDLYETFD